MPFGPNIRGFDIQPGSVEGTLNGSSSSGDEFESDYQRYSKILTEPEEEQSRVEPKRVNALDRVLGALSKGLQTYARGLGADIQVMDPVQDLIQRRRQEAEEEQERVNLRSHRRDQTRRQAALLGIQEIGSARERKARSQEAAKEREFRLSDSAEDRRLRAEENEKDRTIRQTEFQAEISSRERVEGAKRTSEERDRDLRRDLDDDDDPGGKDKTDERTRAKERRSSIKAVKAMIAGTADKYERHIARGKTPGQIAQKVQEQIAIEGLQDDDEATDEIMQFYESTLAPKIRGFSPARK